MAITVANEGGTHFSITHGTNDVDRYAKNTIIMNRRGDEFKFFTSDNKGVVLKANETAFTVPAHVEVLSEGTVQLSAGASGRINGVTVNSVEMLSNAETVSTGTVQVTGGPPVVATGTFTVDTSITEGLHGTSVLTSTGASAPAVYASNVLTSTGACVPAVFAESVLTLDAALGDGNTVTIDGTVYRFEVTPSQAYDINLGASDAVALDNLKAGINATGTGDGSDYYTGTNVHPTVIATTNADTTQKVVARTIGTVSNAEATTTTGGNCSWADTTLGGGTGTSVTGVVTTSATVTIDSTVYIAVTSLAETHGLTAVTEDVLWVTDEATFLDNLKSAINNTATEGTDYATGTVVHPTVIASINTDTQQTVVARTIGTVSNAEATTDTLANYTWADTTLGGGTGASVTGVVTTAALITINATIYTAVTSLAETHGLSAIAFQVLWVTNEATFLDNFKSAINLGGTIGTDYATGTTAHPTVVATTNTDTAQTIVVKIPGTASNAEVTQETLGNYAWTGADIANGTVAGLAGDTVTIDTVTYTFLDILSEDHSDAIINQVHWVTTDAVALDNFKSAINLTGSIGTDYSTGTAIHPTVTATTNGAATQVVAAKTVGTGGNSIATTETGSTLSWGAVNLEGGLDSSMDGITVNSIEVMSGAESFDTTLDITATNVAANITAFTSTPNYTATAATDTVTISAAAGTGYTPNAFTVTASKTTLTTTDGNMASGVAANSVPFNTTLNQTATDLATNIQANTTSPNYTAAAVTDTVTITAAADTGNEPNGFVVTSDPTTITTVDVDMGTAQTGESEADVLEDALHAIIYE
ncbi:hypothetical protein LCGC14_1101460 [marine sediment metagenome]|uniref:Uncharacterized protein n=1 Tax=marine sediment metagenome TaxID=412755 RepID=A0A0F9M9C7_9ZZZZ